MKCIVYITLLMTAFAVSAGEMTVQIPVDASSINFDEAGIYTRITGTGMGLMGAEGNPSLPEFTARIALPTGCAATLIEVVDAVYTPVRGSFTVMPATASVPLSVEQDIYPVEPNPEIYGSAIPYPHRPISFEGSSVIMGIPVAYLRVFPVKWNPASGTVEVLSNLTLNVTYETSPEASTVSRRSLQSELRSREIVMNSVVNPEGVSASGAAIVDSKALAYGEYVIITYPAYESYAQDLADWKTSKGVPTNVYTTTWIQTQYTCADLQQEIRAFLTDCITEGAEYVLIYGDDDRIAGRDARIHYSSYTEYPPVDLYFADINDTAPGADRWNSNGNSIWGEYGVDNVDYHPDLWVGRASVNTTGECTIFNQKVYTYEQIDTPISDFSAPIELRIGYTTEMLWPGCYGSAGAQLISNYVPSAWEEEKCYDSASNNSVTITRNMINDGPHHLYHASHGSQTSFSLPGGSYTTSDFMNQTNISGGGLPAIWNSISCLIGYLDYGSDCMADAWNNSPNGGGFGAFNARYGWGNPSSPGYGESEILSRYFYDVMWNDDLYNLGVAHAMGNDEMSPPSTEISDWCVKEYNLFGDPELPMWFLDADILSASHPGSISGAGNVTVTVTDPTDAPVSGARVCLQKGNWQTGEVYEVGTTNSSGSVTLYVNPTTTGTISVVAWARDHISYQGSITVLGVGVEEGRTPPVFTNSTGAVYPSPAMSIATIPFSIAAAGATRVDVYDVTGRIVVTLAAEEMAAGQHNLVWNLEDDNGTAIPSGVYHVRIVAADWTGTTNLVVTR